MSDTPGDLLDSEAIKFDDPLAAPQQDASGSQLDVIMGIPVVLQVVLGELKLPVSELYNLGPGSVLELDRRIGEPVDLLGQLGRGLHLELFAQRGSVGGELGQ